MTLLLADIAEIGIWDRPPGTFIHASRLVLSPSSPRDARGRKIAGSNRRVIGVRISSRLRSPRPRGRQGEQPARLGETCDRAAGGLYHRGRRDRCRLSRLRRDVDFGPLHPEVSTIVDLTGPEAVIVRQGAGRLE